ncbi:uncharacterized protein LOC113314392 isoform X3 [Papaver somniferum]|uniref:uncharacterized protein LOC113314392 isoform X3 n=1 Tax=Papaver somniferum TaxID=3469 RepID=UPI000E6F75BE|nr:uncharacterized protein LOC113314392 isoform X3 [Papaver somniferum]
MLIKWAWKLVTKMIRIIIRALESVFSSCVFRFQRKLFGVQVTRVFPLAFPENNSFQVCIEAAVLSSIKEQYRGYNTFKIVKAMAAAGKIAVGEFLQGSQRQNLFLQRNVSKQRCRLLCSSLQRQSLSRRTTGRGLRSTSKSLLPVKPRVLVLGEASSYFDQNFMKSGNSGEKVKETPYLASKLRILTEGASDYGKFGEPLIQGYTRTFDGANVLSEAISEHGISTDGGTDSLPVSAHASGEVVEVPGDLVSTVYATSPDIALTVTEDLSHGDDGVLLAVPKKRTSISKKRIRKNVWKRKGYQAALKAYSLAKSLSTGNSRSFFYSRNNVKSCVP